MFLAQRQVEGNYQRYHINRVLLLFTATPPASVITCCELIAAFNLFYCYFKCSSLHSIDVSMYRHIRCRVNHMIILCSTSNNLFPPLSFYTQRFTQTYARKFFTLSWAYLMCWFTLKETAIINTFSLSLFFNYFVT